MSDNDAVTRSPGGLHERLLDTLGIQIASGTLEPGTALSIDELSERYGVSRPVVREVLRVLSSMGLVRSRRRIGTRVLPASEWNLYDPVVIRWRLAGPDRLTQLHSLTELRSAVEPLAARLAADRVANGAAGDLVALAARLWAAGASGHGEDFLRIDIEFHTAVLAASGNEMFTQLHSVVAEVLHGRDVYGLVPQHPEHEALQDHLDVATAVQRGDGDLAFAAMSRIMERSIEEMDSLWGGDATTPAAPGSPVPPPPDGASVADGR